MNKTSIEWCDYTANPLKFQVEGDKPRNLCVKISPGCANCYSETITKRFGGLPFTKDSMSKATPLLVEAELKKMLTFKPKPPFKNGRDRAAAFPFDMTDVFGEWVPDELIDKIFAVFALRPDVDWLVLTKRAERMRDYFRSAAALPPPHPTREWGEPRPRAMAVVDAIDGHFEKWDRFRAAAISIENEEWPLPNVWLGVSVEDQARADERIPLLLETPAAVRFLSVEPMLGAVDLNLMDDYYGDPDVPGGARSCHSGRISLVIVGGESGPGARYCSVRWIRSIVAQCKAAGVPVFVKQLGSSPAFASQNGLDPLKEALRIRDPKGGNPEEWPEDLRVREMPGIDAPKE